MQSSSIEHNTRYYCLLVLLPRTCDVRDKLSQTEGKFITALENDDVPTVEQMLSSDEISLPHKIDRYPISALIMRSLSPNMIRMAVRNYPDVFLGRSDRFIELIRCVWDARHDHLPLYYKSTDSVNRHDSYTRAFEIIDLFIGLHRENTSASPVQLMEAVFGKRDDTSYDGASPFTNACWKGFVEIATKFLDLITDETREYLREEWFERHESLGGCNVFHYADSLPVDLVKAMIDRLPFSRSLLNANRSESVDHPLFTSGIIQNKPDSAPIARLYVLHGGARVDPLNRHGSTPLLAAIKRGNLEMVECFLRLGARTDIVDRQGNTALSLALRFGYGTHPNAKDGSSRMVELLLAFGVDLGKEACLRTLVPPNPNQDPNNKSLRELLCDLRDSNSMHSLARLCRKVIRRQMGPNADEKIRDGTIGLPQNLKSYLLFENEPPVLVGRCD